MVRRIPRADELRTMLDARLTEAEAALRAAEAAGVISTELRARHAAVLEALTALRDQIEAAGE